MTSSSAQSRYESADEGLGDYLNAPFDKQTYDDFIEALLSAERVIAKSFESKDLFQACQPIEEIARAGHDAPRFGTLKPVGLTDPKTEGGLGRLCSLGRKTRMVRATTWWAFRPISRFPSSAGCSA